MPHVRQNGIRKWGQVAVVGKSGQNAKRRRARRAPCKQIMCAVTDHDRVLGCDAQLRERPQDGARRWLGAMARIVSKNSPEPFDNPAALKMCPRGAFGIVGDHGQPDSPSQEVVKERAQRNGRRQIHLRSRRVDPAYKRGARVPRNVVQQKIRHFASGPGNGRTARHKAPCPRGIEPDIQTHRGHACTRQGAQRCTRQVTPTCSVAEQTYGCPRQVRENGEGC